MSPLSLPHTTLELMVGSAHRAETLWLVIVVAMFLACVWREVPAAWRHPRPSWAFLLATSATLAVSVVVGSLWVPPGPLEAGSQGLQTVAHALASDVLGPTERGQGPVHHVVYRLIARAFVPAEQPWAAGQVVSVAAGMCMALWVRRWSGSNAKGVLAAAMLCWMPIHVRMAGGLSRHLVAELFVLLACLGLEAWFVSGTHTALGLSLTALVLASGSSADVALVAPLILGGVLVARGRWAWARSRLDRTAWAWLGSAGLLWVLRVSADSMAWSIEGAQERWLPPIAVATTLFYLASRLPRLPPVLDGVLVGSVALIGVALAPWSFDGTFPRLPGMVSDLAQVQPGWHLTLSPLVAWVLGLLGLASLRHVSPAAVTLVLVLQAGLALFHLVVLGEHALSVFLLLAAAQTWVWVALAILALPDVGGAVAALALLLMASTMILPYQRVLRHAWPAQQEARLLFDDARRLGRHGRLVFLAPEDVIPPLVAQEVLTGRPDLREIVREDAFPSIYSAGRALAEPHDFVGAAWFHGLACSGAGWGVSRRLRAQAGGADVVVAAGRAWAWRRPVAPDDERAVAPPVAPPLLSVSDLPCLVETDAARCVEEVDGGCLIWSCPEGTELPADTHGYVDPVCRAMEERFELQAIRSQRVGRGALGSDTTQSVTPRPHIGLYRIIGVKVPSRPRR